MSRVGPVDNNHICFYTIFIEIKLEIEDIPIRYQIKNHAKILSILVMGAIIVKPILFVDYDSFLKNIFRIETAPANQVPRVL